MTAGLLGRERELGRLRVAMDDPDIAAVLLRGPAGAGKSALAQVLVAEASAGGAMVGARKYAEGEGQASIRPVVEALAEIVSQALNQLYDPQTGLRSLKQALGPGLAPLTQVGFRVEGLASLAVADLASERQVAVRLISAVLRVVEWLRGFGLPVVLLLDDWRRSGAQARRLFMALLGRAAEANLKLLLTERDDEEPDPLSSRDDVLCMEVGQISASDRLSLFSRELDSEDAAVALVDWLGPDCPTLPFDIIEAARGIRAAGAIRRSGKGWSLELHKVADLDRPDLVRGLVRRLHDLPDHAKQVALALALWGDQAPVRWLARSVGCNASDLGASATRLQAVGLLWRQGDSLRFRHDRLRAGTLDAFDEAERRQLASDMAERLGEVVQEGWGELLEPALQLRLSGGIDATLSARWRVRFAQGAAEARARVDGPSANRFAETAFQLLMAEHTGEPAENRVILREAAFAAADRNDSEATLARTRLLLGASENPSQLAESYEAGAAALRLADDLGASWALGREGLARMGLQLPATASRMAILLAAVHWKLRRLCRQRPPVAIVADSEPDHRTRIAHVAATAVYESDPAMAALLALRGLALEPRSGPRSAFWLAAEAFVSASMGEFERAAQLGEMVVSSPIAAGFGAAATLYRALYWGLIWRRPQLELRPRCDEVRDLAIAEGDLVQAAIAIRNRLFMGWRTCAALEELAADVEGARRDIALIGEPTAERHIEELAAVLGRLQRRNGPPLSELAEQLATFEAPDLLPRAVLAFEVASLSGDWSAAAALARRVARVKHTFDSHPGGVIWRFHEAIWRLKTGRPVARADLRYVRHAAGLNPTDHRHKVLIIDAERLRANGDLASLTAYSVAVEAARGSSSRLEAGLAAELAAQAAREFGHSDLAERYLARAQEIWSAWGALAKLRPREIASGSVDRPAPLVEARAEAEAARLQDRAKSRLLAEVAHELRTPLQGMQGLLDLAAETQAPLDVGPFRAVFSSLRSVIDDLTEFGAVTSGDAPLASVKADLVELIRSEVKLAASLEPLRQAKLDLDIVPEAPAWIETDPPRVRQVLRNLLSNAAKYGGGDFLRVSLRSHRPGEAGLVELSIAVEDSGPGLGVGDALLLFEPFERGLRQGDGAGLGLGLALSRKIARRLGGDLIGENRSEGGARFLFSFLAREAIEDDESTSLVPPAVPLRIVVADDVELVRRVVSAILRRRGHSVTEARDGSEALEVIAGGQCDLAILDMTMPGASGIEVARRLGGQGGTRPATILLTASSIEDIGPEAMAAGVDLILRKPVSADDLGRAVAGLFQARQRDDGGSTGSIEVELAALAELARLELRGRIDSLVAGVCAGESPDTGAEAHRIAGLAAQFGWPVIAALADELERAARSKSDETEALAVRLGTEARSLEVGCSAA